MDSTDVLVIGAGVVGLACARALARAGREVIVLEQAAYYGTGASSRNSEVIHAGLHGEPGSLKASLCVRGKHLLYAFCAHHGVAYQRCGKLLVANGPAEEAQLHSLQVRARHNGVDDLVWLTGAEARAMEPALVCTAALLSPSSGIVDSHALMTALLAGAESHGALLACHGALLRAEPTQNGWHVQVGERVTAALKDDAGARVFTLQARWLVNAAGLDAQAVAGAMHGFPPAAIPRRYVAKGHYFSLAAKAPFTRLIYPTPEDGGLGVHLTLDLGGQARFGPDVEWLDSSARADRLDYDVDASRLPAFEAAVRRYWPGLAPGALSPAYCGVRSKLSGPGQPAADFRIDGPAAHGCAGVVQLFGIESPGLTACLAIAEKVADIVTAD